MIPVIIKMGYIRSIFCFLLICLFGSGVYAQTPEVGVIAGGAGYMGDLNQDNPLKISGLSAGAFVKLNLDPYWNIGLHYTYARIKGNDSLSNNAQFRERNLRFFTPISEVSIQGEFNFFDYFAGGGRRSFSPYIFTGISGFFFNPKTKINNNSNVVSLAYYRTEGQADAYKQYGISIPYGVGAKIRFRENWSLFGQVGYRTAFTDYLDDVSGYYPDPETPTWPVDTNLPIRQLLSDRSGETTGVYIGAKHTQRGDLRKRDTYMFAGIGISFTFVSQKCYTF